VLHFITTRVTRSTRRAAAAGRSPRQYVGAAIFATSLMLLYASSANYHLVPWPHSLRRVWKRVDHSMIFVLIAGTYTPFCVVVLDDAWGIPMLSVVWTLAVRDGAEGRQSNAPRWLSVVYIGWVGVVAATEVVTPAAALAMPVEETGATILRAGSEL
jgi:hemolysin III